MFKKVQNLHVLLAVVFLNPLVPVALELILGIKK